MKVVILCGGRGTRLGKQGESVPKALVEIGGKPIIWHLLRLYSHYGQSDFVLCLGYLGDRIREALTASPIADEVSITFAETGVDTNTGGRIKRIEDLLAGEADFCVTYGDGLADVDLGALREFHQEDGKIGTITAARPFSPFGLIDLDEDGSLIRFREKPKLDQWINGGFMVFKSRILDYLNEDSVLESDALHKLASEGELSCFRHEGFWKCMDTFKDNLEFNQLWDTGEAAWKVW